MRGMIGALVGLTALLSMLVAVMASGLTDVLLRLGGLEVLTRGQAVAVCAVMCLILAPPVLGPLVFLVMRHAARGQRLRRAALTDPLTGLPNRRAFFDHAAARLGPAGEARGFALLMIDLDHFKGINDRLGHEGGDAALCFVTERLRDAVARAGGRDAFLARLGGEEFVILQAGAKAAGGARLAAAICKALREVPFEHRGARLTLTASVGVWAGQSGEVDRPLALADEAVYAAKAMGRDRWVVAGQGTAQAESPRAA